MYYIYTLYKVTSQNVIEFHVFHGRFYRSDQIGYCYGGVT